MVFSSKRLYFREAPYTFSADLSRYFYNNRETFCQTSCWPGVLVATSSYQIVLAEYLSDSAIPFKHGFPSHDKIKVKTSHPYPSHFKFTNRLSKISSTFRLESKTDST
jgi:hypothetical protein